MKEKFEQQPILRKEELASPAYPDSKVINYYDQQNKLVRMERYFREKPTNIEEYEYDERGRMVHMVDKDTEKEGEIYRERFFHYRELSGGAFIKDTYSKNPDIEKDAKTIKEDWYDGQGRIITEIDHFWDERKDYEYEGDETEPAQMTATTIHGTRTWNLKEDK